MPLKSIDQSINYIYYIIINEIQLYLYFSDGIVMERYIKIQTILRCYFKLGLKNAEIALQNSRKWMKANNIWPFYPKLE